MWRVKWKESVESEVESVECGGAWSAELKVRSVECKVWRVECKVWSVE